MIMVIACGASRTPSEFVNLDWAFIPGRCPGLELTNAFGVGQSSM